MLIARAERLQEAIKGVEERARLLAHSQSIQSHAQKLTDKSREMTALMTSRAALESRGYDAAPSVTAIRVAVEALRSVQNRIATDAGVAADPTVLAPLFTALNRLANELRSELTTAWRQYASARIPALSSDVLDVLRKISDLRPQVTRVEQRLRELEQRREQLPSQPEEIASFEASVEEVEGLWHSLGGDSLPSEVLQFLQEAGTAGAALERLSPAVIEWLRNHNLWTAFRITVARETTWPTTSR